MADDLRLMELDVVSMVHLAKRLVPAMVRRGELRFTASPGSDHARPVRHGVLRTGRNSDTKVDSGKKGDPADVARDGFEALKAGTDHVVAGSAMKRAQTAASTILPDPMKARVHASMTEPGSGDS